MARIRLFCLSLLPLLGASPLATAEESGVFDCEGAPEALREIQRQQLNLTSEESADNLLELEEKFDRHKAHLTLLKGMQKLNREYRNLKGLIRRQASAPVQSRGELWELSERLLEHRPTVLKVAIANRLLTILANPEGDPNLDGALEKLVNTENSVIDTDKVWNLFREHCGRVLTSAQCRQLNSRRRGDSFARGMAGLLADAAGALRVDCTEVRNCSAEKREQFKQNVENYRDALLDHIDLAQWENSSFASEEYKTMVLFREQLAKCNENCQTAMTKLNKAVVAYRDKVRSLETRPDGSARAWSALEQFNQSADRIRTDRWRGAEVNRNLIDRYVRADTRGRNSLKLTPAELSVARMEISRKEVFGALSADTYKQSREQIRQNFAREVNVRSREFFSDESLDARRKRFNRTLQQLLGTEPEGEFLAIDSKDRIRLDEGRFFGRLDALGEEGRSALQERIDHEVAVAQRELDSLSREIASVKGSEAFRSGEKLKRYVLNRFGKNCRNRNSGGSIRCKLLPGSSGGEMVVGLGEDWGEILTVVESPGDPGHIRASRQICGSTGRYSSACSLVRREYRRSHPSGTIDDVIKRNRRDTFVYNAQGRVVDRILHDSSTWELVGQGISSGLASNMGTLFLYLSQNNFEDQLASYVEWGQQEETWYHQSQQYREYVEERWVEDMFNHLNPNFAPAPIPGN